MKAVSTLLLGLTMFSSTVFASTEVTKFDYFRDGVKKEMINERYDFRDEKCGVLKLTYTEKVTGNTPSEVGKRIVVFQSGVQLKTIKFDGKENMLFYNVEVALSNNRRSNIQTNAILDAVDTLYMPTYGREFVDYYIFDLSGGNITVYDLDENKTIKVIAPN